MHKFFKKITKIFSLTTGILLIVFMLTYLCFSEVFKYSLMKCLVIQYHALENRPDDDAKVIVVGGSNVAFSVDSDYLGDLIGRPVYNLGVHVGTGMPYPFELAESQLQEGDILIFPFEDFEGDNYGMNLINMAIENEPDMLWSFVLKHPQHILRSMGPAASIKLFQGGYNMLKQISKQPRNAYDSRSFDPTTGNFIYDKSETLLDESTLKEPAPLITDELDQSGIAYLNHMEDLCREKGARLYITWPPKWEGVDPVMEDREVRLEVEKLQLQLEANIISDPLDYRFAADELYDSTAHLNTLGTKRYAELLASDIKNALASEGL